MKKKIQPTAKRKSAASRGLNALKIRIIEHEANVKKRFQQGERKMSTLATKDDLSIVMSDQASKTDVRKLRSDLFDEHGNPLFATKEDMLPLLNLYKGSTFVKSFAAGAAAFVITMVAVGYAILQLVGWIRGTPHL